MLCTVTVRRLKPGTYEAFREAVAADVLARGPDEHQASCATRRTPTRSARSATSTCPRTRSRTLRDSPELLIAEAERIERVAAFADDRPRQRRLRARRRPAPAGLSAMGALADHVRSYYGALNSGDADAVARSLHRATRPTGTRGARRRSAPAQIGEHTHLGRRAPERRLDDRAPRRGRRTRS